MLPVISSITIASNFSLYTLKLHYSHLTDGRLLSIDVFLTRYYYNETISILTSSQGLTRIQL